MIESWHVEVEVTEFEGKILGQCAVIRADGTECPVDKVVIDTGQAWDVLAPLAHVKREGLVLRDLHRQQLRTVAGAMDVDCGAATLRIGRWVFDVQIAIYGGSDWMIGWPILQHLDLLVRPVTGRTPMLVGAAVEHLLMPRG